MARLFWLCIGLCLCQNALALRDPTQPANVSGASYGSGQAVSLIIVSDTRKMAVMNGQFVTIGDTVGQDKIIDITQDKVVLEDLSTGVHIEHPLVDVNIRMESKAE